jgi:glucokinase
VKALVIDLGGTHATCGVVEDRTILAHEVIDTDRAKSLREVLPRIADVLHRLTIAKSLSFRECFGVAVGFSGLVDSRAGRVLATNEKYEDAKEIDLPTWSLKTLGLPLRIENDARMALLGEFYAGAARGFSEVVMMTLGTGIGGVAMMDGKLLRGKHFQGGCLGGHLPVLFTGRACNCGAIGCAEAEASGWSLPRVVNDSPGLSRSTLSKYPDTGFKELFEEAVRGDALAIAIRDRCLQIWAAVAVGLVHAYDPEIIVMGGGVMRSAALIVPYVESYVHRHSWTPWGKVQVRVAELGNEAALLGAVPLLSEN